MLIQSVHYTFSPADADRVAAIFEELRDLSQAESGVISFRIARSNDKPNVFALWEEYRDDAALSDHLASRHFQRLVIEGIRPLATARVGEIGVPLP